MNETSRVRAAAVTGLGALLALASAAGAEPREVTLLAINDVYRIEGVNDGEAGGLARVRTLRQELEAVNPPVLLLHAGDLLYPSLLSRTFDGEQMIDVLNLLDGVDDPNRPDPHMFVVFGNHEFDERECKDAPELRKRIRASQFTWLRTNLEFAPCLEEELIPAERLKRSDIVEINGLRVGLFGLTIDSARPEYVEAFRNPKAVAERVANELREADGADVVVALSHLTHDEDLDILRSLRPRGPDLIVGGHEHRRMIWEEEEPLFKADSDARSANAIRIARDADGRLLITAENRALDKWTQSQDPMVDKRVGFWLGEHAKRFCGAEGADCLDAELGATEVPLVGEELAIRSKETALGNWVADRMRAAFEDCGAQVAFVNSGALRLNQDVAPGPVKRRHLEELVQYQSRLRMIEINGATLNEVIGHAVSGWPDQGHWLQVSGLAFRHDGRGGVSDLTLLGARARRLDPAERIRAVTIDYLIDPARDQDGFTMLRPEIVAQDCAVSGQDLKSLLRSSLESGPPIDVAVEGRICEAGAGPCLAIAATEPLTSGWIVLAIVLAAAIVLALPALLPMLLFVSWGWKARRNDVLGLFTTDAIEHYFFQFYPHYELFGIAVSRDRHTRLRDALDKHYTSNASRRSFSVGLVLFGLLILAGLVGVAWTTFVALVEIELAVEIPSLPWVAVAAFVGAYLWVAVALILRWRSRSLTELEPFQAALRIAISVPFAYALAGALDDPLQVPAAFFLGAIPLDQLVQIARQFVFRWTELDVEPGAAQLQILKLSSVDHSTAQRLASQGVTTIAGLAYCNPVVIAVRTQLEFLHVSACVNEALLWQYAKDSTPKLASLGVGGAQEAANLYDKLQRDRAAMTPVLQEVADALEVGKDPAENLLWEVSQDPHTRLLKLLWKRPDEALVRALGQAQLVFRGRLLSADGPGAPPHLRAVRYAVEDVLEAPDGFDRDPPVAVHHLIEPSEPVDPTRHVDLSVADPATEFAGMSLLVIAHLVGGQWRAGGSPLLGTEQNEHLLRSLLVLRDEERAPLGGPRFAWLRRALTASAANEAR